jgi:hypothetical protein
MERLGLAERPRSRVGRHYLAEHSLGLRSNIANTVESITKSIVEAIMELIVEAMYQNRHATEQVDYTGVMTGAVKA